MGTVAATTIAIVLVIAVSVAVVWIPLHLWFWYDDYRHRRECLRRFDAFVETLDRERRD